MTSTSLWLSSASLLVIAFASVAAKSLRRFSRHKLHELAEHDEGMERFSEILRQHDPVALAAESMQVVATAVLVFSGGHWFWVHVSANFWLLGLLAGVLLLFMEIWLPWAISRLWAEPFIYHTWPVLRALRSVMGPLEGSARMVDIVLHRLAGRTLQPVDADSFDEEIRAVVSEGHREGFLEEDEREMIEGVIELGDVTVSQIMTPRTNMECIQCDVPIEDAVQVIASQGRARVPVYGRNLDDILGVVYAKDLLHELALRNGSPPRQLPEIMRKPYFVPETKSLKTVLEEFQEKHIHMAIVLDEYGGVSGLVTIEDVLEEIVGEIVDEYDQEVDEGILIINDGTYEVLSRVHIDEVNETLDLELPEEGDFDTVGGLVFSSLGHIPVAGETVELPGARLTVLEATNRRIERLKIERTGEEEGQFRESA